MSTPVTVNIPHTLGRAEARRRIDSGFARLAAQLPSSGSGPEQRWDEDRLTFRMSTLGQTIAGVIDVREDTVAMQIELPGMLGLLAGGLTNRLRQAGQLLLTRK